MAHTGLGAYLEREFDGRGWSQREAARRLEMSLTTLNQLINDPDREVELPTLAHIATKLAVPLRRLLEAAGYAVEDADPPPPLTDAERAMLDRLSAPQRAALMEHLRQMLGDDPAHL